MIRRELQHIERRQPIFDREAAKDVSIDHVQREWQVFTELIRRQIVADPSFRSVLARYISLPLSDSLPGQLYTEIIATQDNVGTHTKELEELGRFLSIPAIPDQLLVPDIKSAPFHITPEEIISRYQLDDAAIDAEAAAAEAQKLEEKLDRAVTEGLFVRGVTPREKWLTFHRYELARDVKLLALSAEFLDSQIEFGSPDESHFIHKQLPSGVDIACLPAELAAHASLLNPETWKHRRQLKDRVYRVTTNQGSYILKEHKTNRHRHTRSTSSHYMEANSSAVEAGYAARLNTEGHLLDTEVEVVWERPIGYVSFPDGFSFAIFHDEKDLIAPPDAYSHDPDELTRKLIAEAIIKQPEHYQREYLQTNILMRQFAQDKRVGTKQPSLNLSLQDYVQKVLDLIKHKPLLSFEDFSIAKAEQLLHRVTEGREQMKNQCRLVDTDRGRQYAYRIREQAAGIVLQIVGFDFEYMEEQNEQITNEAWQRSQSIERKNETVNMRIRHLQTKEQQAAYLALLSLHLLP